MSQIGKKVSRDRRHVRIRRKIVGTTSRPRLCVFRSNRYVYAQIIDDTLGVTIASASSLEKDLRVKFGGKVNLTVASEIGKLVASRAQEKGVKNVVFDRGGFIYHGRIKALADAAREAGLDF